MADQSGIEWFDEPARNPRRLDPLDPGGLAVPWSTYSHLDDVTGRPAMADSTVVAAVCLCGRMLIEHIEEPINPELIVQPPIAPPDCDGFDLAYYVTDDGGIVQP